MSEIRWIECKADAPVLPYYSGIVSLDMEKNPWQLTGLGEVFGAPRTFTGERAPTGFDGSHLCGEKLDFNEGGAYLPDIPPAPYDSQGFLGCCMVPAPPPPPPPICGSCSDPQIGTVGVTYTHTIPPGCVVWYRYDPIPNGNHFIFVSTVGGGAFVLGVIYPSATSCAALGPATPLAGNAGVTVTVTTGRLYMSWVNATGLTQTFSVTVVF